MLYIRSSDLAHLIAESLYPFTNHSLSPPPPEILVLLLQQDLKREF